MKKSFPLLALFIIAVQMAFLPGCSGGSGKGETLPTDPPYTQTVGPAGATVTDPDGGEVIIPAGALAKNTDITIKTYPNQNDLNSALGLTPFHGGVDFGPDGTSFSVPVTIRIPVSLKLEPGDKRSLYLYNRSTSRWEETACTAEVDSTGTYLCAQVTHFCTFAGGLFPMDFYSDFMYFFNGSNIDFAIQAFANVFCKVTGLNMGQTFEAGGKFYVVQGINFDVQYSVDDVGSEASVDVGTFNASSTKSYAVQSRAYDYMSSSGRQIEYEMQVTVCFMEAAAPVNGLSVTIYQPANGKVISGTEAVRTVVNQTSGSSAITKVEFYVDGSSLGTRTSAPYEIGWDTSSLADGAYILTAKAYNADGASTTSAAVTVQKGATDRIPPEPYVLSNLNMTDMKARSLKLEWHRAADETTAQGSLEYLLVRSASPNIDTVAKALANGTIVKAWTTDLTGFEVTSLTPQTQYYFNLLVRDAAFNVAAYTMCSAKTFPYATGFRFTDNNTAKGTISGNIVFNAVTDESEIHDYIVYLGKTKTVKYSGRPLIVIPKTGVGAYTVTLPATGKPIGATDMLLYTRKEVSAGVYEESPEPACCPVRDKGMIGIVMQTCDAIIEWDPGQFPPDHPGMTWHYCDVTGALHAYTIDGNILTLTHSDVGGGPCGSLFYWSFTGYLWDGTWLEVNNSGMIKISGEIGTLPGTYRKYGGHLSDEGTYHVHDETVTIATDGSWTYTDPETGSTTSGVAQLYGDEDSYAYFTDSPFINNYKFFWGTGGEISWYNP